MTRYDDEMSKLAQVGAMTGGAVANPIGQYVPPTDRQKLEEKKSILAQELRSVLDAIDALDKHPELEEFTKILQRGLR